MAGKRHVKSPRGPSAQRGAADELGEAAWRDFLERVDGARQALGYTRWGGDRECYFRGLPDDTWSLAPSLLRAASARSPSRKARADPSALENDLFFEFRARARELHSPSLGSWDVLFAMQHFGVPTRLLDWSEDFAVALYFAILGGGTGAGRPCIWVMNPYRLNEHAGFGADLMAPRYLGWDPDEETYSDYEDLLIEDEGMGFDRPVAVYPELKNDRIQAQRGSFTIHGDAPEPLDVQLKREPDILRKVVLAPEAIPAARKYLDQAGIDHQRLFPDLAGLAVSLRRKYGLPAG